MPLPLRRDNRGQAIGISRLLLSLFAGSILFWIISEVTTPLFKHANNQTTANTEYAQATQWLEQGINALPLVFLVLGLFGIIAYSVFTREMLR